MNLSKNANHDTCLMHGMADRMGVDVDRAAMSGALDEAERNEMVERCGQCSQHDACILWLMEHQGEQVTTPSYCLNTNELNYLRALSEPIPA